MSTALRTREFTLRAQTDDDQRTVTGLAVPYDDEIELYEGMFESVAPGAFRAPDPSATAMKLLWRHDEPIGLITEAEDTDDGLTITARISRTTRGDEAYALLRDGVIDRFSIGFVSLARRGRQLPHPSHRHRGPRGLPRALARLLRRHHHRHPHRTHRHPPGGPHDQHRPRRRRL